MKRLNGSLKSLAGSPVSLRLILSIGVAAIVLIVLPIRRAQSQGNKSQSYSYTAATNAAARRQGLVKAGQWTWDCKGSQCTAPALAGQSDMEACRQLAAAVGSLRSFSRPGMVMAASDVSLCNSKAVAGGIAKPDQAKGGQSDPSKNSEKSGGTPAVKPVKPEAPRPLQKGDVQDKGDAKEQSQGNKSQNYSYTAATNAAARRQGLVKAGQWTWDCKGSQCTAPALSGQSDMEACMQLAANIGSLRSFSRPGMVMPARDLSLCNSKAAGGGIAKPDQAKGADQSRTRPDNASEGKTGSNTDSNKRQSKTIPTAPAHVPGPTGPEPSAPSGPSQPGGPLGPGPGTPGQANQQGYWSLVNRWGIQQDDGVWKTGRIWDALEISDGQVLAASEFSGVWYLRRNTPAVSLSHDWESAKIYSLAKNPTHSGSFFAGGRNVEYGSLGVLHETRQGSSAPLLEAWVTVPLPQGTGPIYRIVTLASSSGPARIVLATDTGILWADIPPTPAPYRWHPAVGVARDKFWDVKEGPNQTIIAGTVTFEPGSDGATPIRLGSWQQVGSTYQLTLQNVTIASTDFDAFNPSTMYATSIGVCDTDRRILYAASSDRMGAQDALGKIGFGELTHIYRSTDGGRTWTPKRAVDSGDGKPSGARTEGRQGIFFNNTIAVSPQDSNRIVVGWVHLLTSTDGGDHFTEQLGLHDDHHTVFFAGSRLYDCSDGGLAYSGDFAKTFNDEFNHLLPTLVFLNYKFDAVVGFRAVTAGGTQDNSCVYCSFPQNGQPGPWKVFEGATNDDGGPVALLQQGAAWTVDGTKYNYSSLGSDGNYAQQGPVNTDGATGAANLFKVTSPVSQDSQGRKIRALIFSEDADRSVQHQAAIFGLYSADSGPPAFKKMALILVQAGGQVTSLASYDGSKIFVGMGPIPAIQSIDMTTRPNPTVVTEGGFPTNVTAYIDNIAAASNNDVFATLSRIGGTSTLYQRAINLHTWTAVQGNLPDQVLTSLACSGPNLLFVSTPTAVWMSQNSRNFWIDISYGLPRYPNAQSLIVGEDNLGNKWLFLATWGWSVWKYRIN
jgi:hypothetical protein